MTDLNSYTYSWVQDGAALEGANSPSYELQPTDEGHRIACVVTATNSLGSTSVTTAATPAVGPPGVAFPMGIAIGSDNVLTQSSDSGLAQYQKMKALGFSSVRIDAYYTPTLPVGNDATIRAAIAAGLNPLIILDGYDISTSVSAFSSFCRSVVATYSPLGVHCYEILNEQNFYINWDTSSSQSVSPSGYANLLRSVYPEIKAADGGSIVLLGGLANVSASDGPYIGAGNYARSLTQTTFMAQVYSAIGGKSAGYFDAVAVHPYTFPTLPTGNGDNFGNSLSPTGTTVRTIMVANGDAAKKLWVTEFGAPTGPDEGQVNYVSSTMQAESFSAALEMCSAWPWVGAFYAFNWNDDNDGDFGLTDASYDPKPALSQVVSFINTSAP